MSEIKALEELRGLPFQGTIGLGNCVTASKEAINAIADEIEAEIAERFMELPVDADGVPIRVGDRLEGWKFPIDEISFAATGIALDNCDGEHVTVHMLETDLHHLKPRTLEDVLREFSDEVIEWSGYSGPVSGDRTWSGMAAKYIDEIREMMGVCE